MVLVWGQTQKYPRIIGIGILNKDKVFRGNLRPLIFGVILICPSGKTKTEPMRNGLRNFYQRKRESWQYKEIVPLQERRL
ncbi:hypothetical protein LEP1GSC086_3481 [Leptospira weilii str. LNT 1234]|nr:hypothetical protein LEP1GSC086_3481 [Leptospira weilii str. LNT 1234]